MYKYIIKYTLYVSVCGVNKVRLYTELKGKQITKFIAKCCCHVDKIYIYIYLYIYSLHPHYKQNIAKISRDFPLVAT